MIISIYYFFVFISLIIIFIDINTNNVVFRKFIGAIVYLALFIFIGFRYEVGMDWVFYHDMYNGDNTIQAVEPGYMLLSTIMSSIMSYWWFQAVITLFSLISFALYFRVITEKYISCILILFIYQFGFNSEALRQIIAVTFVLCGYASYLRDRKITCYILIVVASFFHVSALIAIFPILSLSVNRIKFLQVSCAAGIVLAIVSIYPIDMMLSLIGGLFHNGYIDKILWYGNDSNAGSILTFSIAFKLFIIIMFEVRWKNFRLDSVIKDPQHLVFLKANIYSMLFIDIFLGRYGTISTRLEVYMLPAFIISIVLVLRQFKAGISRVLVCFVISLYLSFNFYNYSSGYFFQNFFMPYSNYIFINNETDIHNGKYDAVKQYVKNKELFQ